MTTTTLQKTRTVTIGRNVRIDVLQHDMQGTPYRTYGFSSPSLTTSSNLTRYGLRMTLTENGFDYDIAHAICDEMDKDIR